jgi:hypothetical protein
MGRRTPTITWTFTPGGTLQGFEGCGNLNELSAREVFVLHPGETRTIDDWVAPLALPPLRRCRAFMVYSNEPNMAFRGVLLRPHDQGALAQLGASDRCRVQSPEVEIVIEGALNTRRLPPVKDY